jgi:hypothetical protein
MFVLLVARDLEQILLVLVPGEDLGVSSLKTHKQKVLVHLQIGNVSVYHDRLVDVTLTFLEAPDLPESDD